MTQVFISYSRKDLAFVERLAKDLQSAGLGVWYDLSGLDGGARWGQEIQSAIQRSQIFVVVLSPNSIDSEWVEKEFMYANSLKRKIIPLLYQPCETPMWFINLHFIDVQGPNYENHLWIILKVMGVKAEEDIHSIHAASENQILPSNMDQPEEHNKTVAPRRKIKILPALLIVLVGLAGVLAFVIWGTPPLKIRLVSTITSPIILVTTAVPTATSTPLAAIILAATTAPVAVVPPTVDPASITIAYSGYGTNNDYWKELGKAAAAEAKAKGVHFVDLTPETQDANAQVHAIDTEISARPSAIIIGAFDPTAFKDTIAKARAAGIPIIATERILDDTDISALVMTDNPATTTFLGQYICKKLDGAKGSALVMAGPVGDLTGDARQKGVADALAACGETVIKQHGNWDVNTEVQITNDTITTTPDLNVIFCSSGTGAAAIATLVKNKNLTGKIMVFGFDGLPVEYQAIQAGIEIATIKQDNVRIGLESVDNALAIINKQPFTATDLITGILIDKTNVAQYLP